MRRKYLINILFICFSAYTIMAQNYKPEDIQNIPKLQKYGSATQLIVDKKPFLLLSGELGNSSASNLEYMESIWPKLSQMHLNSVLVPVYWELLEPQEGKYDFTLVDSAIISARRYNLKIVFLWFGSWKNSMSCYAPYWVKIDQKRFPRAKTKEGVSVEILSPFSEENRNVDARAFESLLKHIRNIDSKENTVVMVQVENEIGMIPDARDYSDKANQMFSKPVPEELLSYLQKNKKSLVPELCEIWKASGFKTYGTWEEVFGKGLQTDELFMAWYFAKFTNFVASKGKDEYPLPMYVNAALIRPGYKPGQYPSAGPLPHLIDIWQAAAPKIDFLAPDIYFKNFSYWCEKFDKSGNPLFIPEVANSQSAVNAYYAFAHHNAIGYSPFSIESLENNDNQISKGYTVLEQLKTLILGNQGKNTMDGVLLDSADQKAQIKFGNYIFNFRHEYSWSYSEKLPGETPRAGGMIIKLAEDEFLIAGSGIIVTFESGTNDGKIAGIASIDEGSYLNGKWVDGRRMNGDQDHQGRHLHLPGRFFGMQKVKLYLYK